MSVLFINYEEMKMLSTVLNVVLQKQFVFILNCPIICSFILLFRSIFPTVCYPFLRSVYEVFVLEF